MISARSLAQCSTQSARSLAQCSTQSAKHVVRSPIRIDSNTLFYVDQPTDQLRAVYAEESSRIMSAFETYQSLHNSANSDAPCLSRAVADGPHHIGSSAIVGMPGTPIVDMAVQLGPGHFPPSQAMVECLSNVGYEYMGASPHDRDDHWCMGGTAGARKGELGRTVLHLSAPGTSFLHNAVSFVDYCNSNEGGSSRMAYAQVKLEGMQLATEATEEEFIDGGEKAGGEPRFTPHVQYKIHKSKVVHAVLERAKQWSTEKKD